MTDWRCPRCRVVLGHVTTTDTLVITAPGTTVERSVLAVVVRCPCGQSKAYSGRHVIIDVPSKAA